MVDVYKRQEYMSQKGVYVLDGEKLKLAKSSLKILHPLPRVDEITYEVDDDPRAVYFEQTEYGMYARMALMMTLMEQHGERCLEPVPASTHDVHCTNPACITSREHYLPHLFEQKGNQLVCRFCDEPVQE